MNFVFVCRHFPPAVSGGARRPYLLARALTDLGHRVHVLAPAPCEGVSVDVVAHPSIDPPIGAAPAGRGLRATLRGLLLPDPDIRWALAAARRDPPFAPDWVVTTSPPESAHVAGWLMKRRFGCRWAADMRDHWLEFPLLAARARFPRRAVERRLARFLLTRADSRFAVSALVARETQALGGPTTVLAPFAERPPARAELAPGLRHVVHTGSFSLSDPGRDIGAALAAVEASEDPNLRLHLAGRLTEAELSRVAASPAAPRIVLHGVLDGAAARALQAAADALLLVVAPGSPHVPGKLAEYRRAGAPIVAIGDGPWREPAGLAPRPPALALTVPPDPRDGTAIGVDPAVAAAAFLAALGRSEA